MSFKSDDEMMHKDVQALQRDIERFKDEMSKEFRIDLKESDGAAREFRIVEQGRLEELADRIEELVSQLQAMLSELRERGPFTLSSAEAVQLAGTAHALEADIDALLALLARIEGELESRGAQSPSRFISGAVQATKRAISTIARVLKPILRAVSARLWKLVVGLLTPKEWSIKGSIGTPVLGLAQAELQITFGPTSSAATP